MENIRRNAEEDYITTPISVLAYISKLEKQSTSQKETVERLREGLLEFKDRCRHNMLNAESKSDSKVWEENFEDLEQLLKETEPKQQ